MVRVDELGFLFDQSSYKLRIGFDSKVMGDTYRVVGEADSYKTIEVTIDIPLEGEQRTFSIKSKNDYGGGADFQSELKLATPWTETYGISLKSIPSGSGLVIKGRYAILHIQNRK